MRTLCAVTAVGVVIGLSAAAGPDAMASPREGNVNVRIVATAANNGELEQCGCKTNPKGGLARRASLIDTLRAEDPNLLLLDAGDWGDRNPATGPLKADFIFRMMKRMGYDAVTLGEREVATSSVAHYKDLAGDDGPAVLMSNVGHGKVPRTVSESVGDGMHLREVNGVKVGTFALMHDQVLTKVQDENGSLVADDIFTSAERITAELRDQGAEIIVCLAQMELSFADSVVRRVPEIDVAVLGHRGGLRRTHALAGETIVMRVGTRGQYLGWVDLTVDPSGKVVEFDGISTTIDVDKYPPHPEIATLVNELGAEMERLQKEERMIQQIQYQNEQEVDRYLGAEACARCHQPEYEQWKEGPHGHAWATLVDVGMDTNAECVSCHVTGAGEATGFRSAQTHPDLTNVQCESCHQMGTLHESTGDRGELVADSCVGCHDQENSPDFDPVSYMERIRHW
jgi:2',3'-cyclic-nucleotide 2'-phosphodiesterase (5'-nucleotidase family)